MFILIVGCGRVGQFGRAGDAPRGPHCLCARRGPRVARPPRGGPGEELGGPRRPVHGRRRPRDRGPGGRRDRRRADVFIASTDGDNTNIIISQIAKRRYEVPTVIARVLDPLRAEWYARQGLQTVCPTRVAIDMLERPRSARPAGRGGAPDGARKPRREGTSDVHHRRRSGEGRLEPGARAARERPRGDADRERPPPLPDRRAGARAQRLLRRRLRALGAGAGRDAARRHGDRGDRRRRGQHADLPGRAREVPGRPDHRPGQQPAQPPALRPARGQAVASRRPT